jgi:hypothetical protein
MAQIIDMQAMIADELNNDTQAVGPLIEYISYAADLIARLQTYQVTFNRTAVGYDY